MEMQKKQWYCEWMDMHWRKSIGRSVLFLHLCLSDFVAAFLAVNILLGHGNISGLGVGVHLLVLGIGVKGATSENQDDTHQTASRDIIAKAKVSEKSLKTIRGQPKTKKRSEKYFGGGITNKETKETKAIAVSQQHRKRKLTLHGQLPRPCGW